MRLQRVEGTGAGAAREEIEVVLSDRAPDVDEALTVIHDGFVEAGYLAPQASGRRMHPSYHNPGTFFAVAKIGGVPVGASALIADGPFGLPSERAFAEELDALRTGGAGEVRECGSLSVRTPWRRHTGRIFLRMMAAITRVIWEECPDAHIVLAVPPEGTRFHGSLFGAEPVAEPRPLYGAPAILLRTDGPTLAECYARSLTSSQRTMHLLSTEPDPAWLSDQRAGIPWPGDWLQPLLDEQGIHARLEAQLRLLGESCPQALTDLVRELGEPVAA